MRQDKEITVKEIMMSAPVTLGPADTLDVANDIIYLGRVRHIPIVDNGKLVGVISHRDLFGTAATTLLGLKGRPKKALLKSFQIKDLMRKLVLTISPDAPVKDAARLMADKKVGCLPVVDNGSLVGLVTATDILRYVAAAESEER
ncbi:MAG: CBS domain-containing protein [Candidatus Binatia bacterium]